MDDEPRYETIDSHVILHAGTGPVAEIRRQAGLPSDLVVPTLDVTDHDREIIAVEMAALAMASAGVDGGLWYGELTMCDVAVSLYPDRFRCMVFIPDPALLDAEQTLSAIHAAPGMAGIRLTPSWPPTGESMAKLAAGAYDPWFHHAQNLGLPISLYMFGKDLKHVGKIARSYPELKLIIDHLGMDPVPLVPLVQERLDPLQNLLDLAQYENVAVKCSGTPALSYENYPFRDVWPAIHAVLGKFGATRLMWGSDFRRLRTLRPYAEIVGFIRYSEQLSVAEKQQILGASLKEWVGWDLPKHSKR